MAIIAFRLVGDILARYVYWVKGENDKNIPLECLSFDRNNESFNNKEKDWVSEYYPDLKCGWSYATQCIDNGQVKVVNLKKKVVGTNYYCGRRFRRSYRSRNWMGCSV